MDTVSHGQLAAAETFVRRQCADAPDKWLTINAAIWAGLARTDLLGLSDLDQIAAQCRVTWDEVLSLVSLLSGGGRYLRLIYYRPRPDGGRDLVAPQEVVAHLRQALQAGDEAAWRAWGVEVLAGWEAVAPFPAEAGYGQEACGEKK